MRRVAVVAALSVAAPSLTLTGCTTGKCEVVVDERAFGLVKYQVEDCTVYRFQDGGEPAYFMRCPHEAIDGSYVTGGKLLHARRGHTNTTVER